VTVVEIPAGLVDHPWLAGPCLRYKPRQTARCIHPAGPADRIIAVQTWHGHFPPFYYVAVGWPMRWLGSPVGVYLTRLCSAGLCAALLSTALVSALRRRSSRLPAVGVTTAATPMVIYLAGTVNPSAVEVAAAVAVWTCGGQLAVGNAEDERFLIRSLIFAAPVLVLTRGAAPVWLAITGLALGVFAGKKRLAELARVRRFRWMLLACAAAGAIALAYNAVGNATELFPVRPLPHGSLPERLRTSAGHVPEWLRQAVAYLGWRDIPLPSAVYWAWGLMVALLVVAALTSAARRQAAAIVLLVTLMLLTSVGIEAVTSPVNGYFWQGRHLLPMAVGVPVLSALAYSGRRRSSAVGGADAGRAAVAVRVGLPVLALAHFIAFLWSVRRYTTGLPGPLLPLHTDWSPPLPPMVLVAGYAVLLALSLAAIYRSLEDGGGREGHAAVGERPAPVELVE
jgi:hypothetical protein